MLALLTPFAHDNIDFSIICQHTKELYGWF